MKLSDYLSTYGLTMAGFARQHGLSKVMVFRACKKGTIPSPEALAEINAATGGLVSANDFYGHTPTNGIVQEAPAECKGKVSRSETAARAVAA